MKEKRQNNPRSKSGKLGRKGTSLPISDDVRRFFPPTSRIGHGHPQPWGSAVGKRRWLELQDGIIVEEV